MHGDGAQHSARSEVAIFPVDRVRADDADRHLAVRNTASATEPTSSLPMGPGEWVPMTTRSISRSRRKPRIWSAGRPARTTISQRSPRAHASASGSRHCDFERGCGVIVVADAGGLRLGYHQRIVGVEEDQVAPNSFACASAKAKAFSLAGVSEAKRMVEGLLHPGLSAIAMGTS